MALDHLTIEQWSDLVVAGALVTVFALSWAIGPSNYPGSKVFLVLGIAPMVYGTYRIHRLKQDRRSEVDS